MAGSGDEDTVRVELMNPNEEKGFANVRVYFKTKELSLVELFFFFSGQSFRFKTYSIKKDNMDGDHAMTQEQIQETFVKPIHAVLPDRILTPFNFSSVNTGKSPKRMLKADELMHLCLQEFDGKPFYLLKQV